MSDPIQEARRLLAQLKQRLVAGEVDRAEYQAQRELVLGDLTAEERAALSTSTPAQSATTPPPATPPPLTPSNLGPSGGSGRGLRTSIPSLADLDLKAGSVLLGQWRLVRELGRGGFGAVFEAEELHLNERQAIKVLDPAMVAREELLARFRREVSLMRKLVHPRIVRVYDYREDLEQLLALISMELVVGGSVKQLLSRAKETKRPVPIPLALEILIQTLEALAEAHAQGVMHRDVTPGNVLLAGGSPEQLLADPTRDPQVKLVDFGIAGLVERSELSQKSRVLGTAAYVAPEVLDPNVEVTPAADVYGAGAMGYELLTGKLPLGRFEEPVGLRGEIDPEVNGFVLSLLAAPPESRPGAKAGAWGLKSLREEAAAAASRREAERRRQVEEEARHSEELARRESEERARQEALRREEEERRREQARLRSESEAARLTAKPQIEPPGHPEQGPQSRKRLSGAAWAGISAAIVVVLIAVGWGISLQRAAEERRRAQQVRLEQEKQVAVEAEKRRAAEAADTERQRQARQLEEEIQKAALVERERIAREQERKAAELVAQRQREAQARARSQPAGTWWDERTGLLWTARDNASSITWNNAKSYCKDLRLGESSDWRLPSIDELEGLYDWTSSKKYKTRGGVELSACCPWSGDLRWRGSEDAWIFNFDYGQRHFVTVSSPGYVIRTLCVRRP